MLIIIIIQQLANTVLPSCTHNVLPLSYTTEGAIYFANQQALNYDDDTWERPQVQLSDAEARHQFVDFIKNFETNDPEAEGSMGDVKIYWYGQHLGV